MTAVPMMAKAGRAGAAFHFCAAMMRTTAAGTKRYNANQLPMETGSRADMTAPMNKRIQRKMTGPVRIVHSRTEFRSQSISIPRTEKRMSGI